MATRSKLKNYENLVGSSADANDAGADFPLEAKFDLSIEKVSIEAHFDPESIVD